MRRIGVFLGSILAVTFMTVACSRTAHERAEQQSAALAADGASGDEVTITGCLTAAPDRDAFVVTAQRSALVSGALYAGDGETPTYAYELVGDTGDLTPHVGHRVEVTGLVDRSRRDEVKVSDEVKTKLPDVQSGRDTVSPAIDTDTEMEINIRRLSVSAVKPIGMSCLTLEQ
jgi:hypothetical protein